MSLLEVAVTQNIPPLSKSAASTLAVPELLPYFGVGFLVSEAQMSQMIGEVGPVSPGLGQAACYFHSFHGLTEIHDSSKHFRSLFNPHLLGAGESSSLSFRLRLNYFFF